MNRRTLVVGISGLAVAAFAGATIYTRNQQEAERVKAAANASALEDSILIRRYSPVLGADTAKVTLVEFFDPSCEACRAFHPIVKQLLKTYPEQVNVVLRYTTFHNGSDEAVRILETARMQDKFEPVLEALLQNQGAWASHGQPNLAVAWQVAGRAGLDLQRAKEDRLFPGITAILNQDAKDVEAAGVRQTPTFFLEGKKLNITSRESLIEAVSAVIDANG